MIDEKYLEPFSYLQPICFFNSHIIYSFYKGEASTHYIAIIIIIAEFGIY
jgi:hypothetical protein